MVQKNAPSMSRRPLKLRQFYVTAADVNGDISRDAAVNENKGKRSFGVYLFWNVTFQRHSSSS